MKMRSHIFLFAGFLATVGAVGVRPLYAQAPPGPMLATTPQPSSMPDTRQQPQKPEVQARTSIFGGWQFNPDDSDDARKKMQDARGADRRGGQGGGGCMRVGGIPGMGGYGGHRRGQENESDQDREKMQALLAPAKSLKVSSQNTSQKDPEIDVTDDQSRKLAVFTDGRKLQKSKDEKYQEITAHWDGAQLVTDEKNPRGGKMSRTYELSPDGKELYETLHLTVGRSNTPVVIRYAFDPVSTGSK